MMRMAIEDKNIGNFWAAMLKLQNVSACSPKCQFTKTVSFKLIGKVTVQSIKSDNARVAMKALCEVLILFLKDKSTFVMECLSQRCILCCNGGFWSETISHIYPSLNPFPFLFITTHPLQFVLVLVSCWIVSYKGRWSVCICSRKFPIVIECRLYRDPISDRQ